MKNNKKLLIITLSILSIVLFFSCQKFETKQVDNELAETTLTNVNISPDFNWESTRKITLNISSSNSQIINITSTDKLIRYYKGILLNSSEAFIIKISVPSHINKLNVNNKELDLNSDNISIDL